MVLNPFDFFFTFCHTKCNFTNFMMPTLAIKKANNALSAIKLIKKYFNKTELLSIITANYYSRLYYNSEIWLLNSLHVRCKQLLLSASAKALKCCMYYPDPTLS